MTRYLAISAIVFLIAGAIILASSVYSHLDYLIRYQAQEKRFLEFDPSTAQCLGYFPCAPSPPQNIPYDRSIPWGLTIGSVMLAGGLIAIFAIYESQKREPPQPPIKAFGAPFKL